MVKLENVNKYFNRRKKNEIHVINNTSLELENKGLVALLGPSGCGKTTLLNVIGGLDKVNKGRVYVNGQKITGRRAGKIDSIRTLNIGYIFQNYNLVDNMTVFDNVAIALKMVGVRDKKEIEEKVNYVLEKVGMYRYRNRYADMLSGGERQRVGIARAIVKNPAVVIADEPTGNLDSRNTLEVMNIIKALSQDKLVILVTHEEELAEFYASRIIRIKDGQVVSDIINDHAGDLDYRIENKIYLRDIRDHKRLRTANYNIDFYNENNGEINLDIVVINGNIYIQAKNQNTRLEVIDDNSGIEFIDDHYKQITKEESAEGNFDLEKLSHKGKRKYKSILNPFTLLKKGFRTVFEYNILKKILLAGFFISAMFITYSVSNIYGVLNITDDEFIEVDKSYITVVGKKIDVDTYETYEKDDDYEYIMPGDSKISLSMVFDDYYQTKDSSADIEGSLSASGKLEESDIVAGRLPENKREIVIDRMLLNKVIKEQGTKSAGYSVPEDFLDETISIPNMRDMTIVGIADRMSPCIYADESRFINILANVRNTEEYEVTDSTVYSETDNSAQGVIDYKLKKSDIELKKGEWPKDDYEVIVNEKNEEDMKIGKEIKQKVNGKKLTVVGYYSDAYDSDYMLVNSDTVKYNLINHSQNITVCPVDKAEAMQAFKDAQINVKDTYAESRKKYKDDIWSSVISSLILAGVMLVISFIEIFLIIRASFLSRVKEVGVYRAIGVKKGDIYKMFMGEILAVTTIASMPGFAFMAYILSKLSQMQWFEDMFYMDSMVLALCAVLIYGFNIVFGLMPVFRTIRKTPAAILSRTDVN